MTRAARTAKKDTRPLAEPRLPLWSRPGYLVRRGLAPAGEAIEVAELPGGVSATVISAQVPATGTAVVVKQALPQLRVQDEWLATPDRAETEVAAMVLCGTITPGVVPEILDSDPTAHVLVMELIPPEARNWQAEVGEGRVHAEAGRWAFQLSVAPLRVVGGTGCPVNPIAVL